MNKMSKKNDIKHENDLSHAFFILLRPNVLRTEPD